jgi:hypothetical protein
VARKKAQRLQAEAEVALAEAEALKVQARLEDLTVWERELVKESKKEVCLSLAYVLHLLGILVEQRVMLYDQGDAMVLLQE